MTPCFCKTLGFKNDLIVLEYIEGQSLNDYLQNKPEVDIVKQIIPRVRPCENQSDSRDKVESRLRKIP